MQADMVPLRPPKSPSFFYFFFFESSYVVICTKPICVCLWTWFPKNFLTPTWQKISFRAEMGAKFCAVCEKNDKMTGPWRRRIEGKKNIYGSSFFNIFFFFFGGRQLANRIQIDRVMESGTCKILCCRPKGLNKNLDVPAIEGCLQEGAGIPSYICLGHVAFDIGPANERALWQTAIRHLALNLRSFKIQSQGGRWVFRKNNAIMKRAPSCIWNFRKTNLWNSEP